MIVLSEFIKILLSIFRKARKNNCRFKNSKNYTEKFEVSCGGKDQITLKDIPAKFKYSLVSIQ